MQGLRPSQTWFSMDTASRNAFWERNLHEDEGTSSMTGMTGKSGQHEAKANKESKKDKKHENGSRKVGNVGGLKKT